MDWASPAALKAALRNAAEALESAPTAPSTSTPHEATKVWLARYEEWRASTALSVAQVLREVLAEGEITH